MQNAFPGGPVSQVAQVHYLLPILQVPLTWIPNRSRSPQVLPRALMGRASQIAAAVPCVVEFGSTSSGPALIRIILLGVAFAIRSPSNISARWLPPAPIVL